MASFTTEGPERIFFFASTGRKPSTSHRAILIQIHSGQGQLMPSFASMPKPETKLMSNPMPCHIIADLARSEESSPP